MAATSFIPLAVSGVRNNSERSVGYEFECLADMVVTAVGRPRNVEMNDPHDIRIWDAATRSLLSMATVTPDSPLDAAGFKIAPLAVPLQLKKGKIYSIVSAERIGGDLWVDETVFKTTADGRVIRPVYTDAEAFGTFPQLTTNKPGAGYVGVTFFYRLAGDGVPLVTLTAPEPQSHVEISRVSGWDSVDISFTSDMDFTKYVIMANGGGGHNIGIEVGGGGSGSAFTERTHTVTAASFEDTQIDKLWRLDVYVLSTDGTWSDGTTKPTLAIKTPPVTTAFDAGSPLDLRGLVVTMTWGVGNAEDVTHDAFHSKGLTALPAHGTILTATDTSVVITHAESGESVSQAIEIREPPRVLSVSVSPAAISKAAGSTQQFTETVTTNREDVSKDVTWSVSGSSGKNTISDTGLLTVHNSEKKGGVFTVRAASVFDPGKYGEATVTVL